MNDAPFLEHLKEFRRRVFWCFAFSALFGCIGYYFYDTFIEVMTAPILHIQGQIKPILVISNLFEGFTTRFKYSLILGCIMSIPVYLYHIIRFLLPALTKRERNIVFAAVGSSAFLSILGFYLCYFYLIPYSVNFLSSEGFVPNHVSLMLQFSQSLDHMFNFLLYTVITFQFPILLEILMYLNIISRKTLLKSTRFVVVIIFVIAAIITPPDVISQCMVAGVLLGLFGLTLLVAYIFRFGEGN